MQIVNDWPPNIAAIRRAFPKAQLIRAVFAYGSVLYNPGENVIPDHLMAHESTHGRQHAAYPGGVEEWWDEYLENPVFRFEQEVEAYGAQYKFVCQEGGANRHNRRHFLDSIARDLSGPLYGNMCSFQQAKERIQNAAN